MRDTHTDAHIYICIYGGNENKKQEEQQRQQSHNIRRWQWHMAYVASIQP